MGTTDRILTNSDSILRLSEVVARTRLSRVTLWRMQRQGLFPLRRRLTGGRAVGWLSSEIEAWIVTRTAVASEASRTAALA